MLLEIGKSHVALNNLMYFAKLNRIWSTLAYFWANFGQILSKPRNFPRKRPFLVEKFLGCNFSFLDEKSRNVHLYSTL